MTKREAIHDILACYEDTYNRSAWLAPATKTLMALGASQEEIAEVVTTEHLCDLCEAEAVAKSKEVTADAS